MVSLSALILIFVLAVGLKTQTVLADVAGRSLCRGFGDLVMLALPACALLLNPEGVFGWREYVYHVGFALTVLLLVLRTRSWEDWWMVPLLWVVLPTITVSHELSLWLAMLAGEFLLLLAYREYSPNSDYHKFALLRIMLIFQYFVVENLFLQVRPIWAGEIIAALLLVLYLASFPTLVRALRGRSAIGWVLIFAYVNFGLLAFDKVVLDAYLQ